MARSQSSFNKREKEKKRLKRREDKQQKKEEKKANAESGNTKLEDMIAYVDEFGNITDTPPDPEQKKKEVKAANIEISTPKKEEEDMTSERRGTVNFYDPTKNYGFINQDGTDERFFVHASSLITPIQEGDKVSFIPKRGMKGMDAVDVKLIK